MLKILERDFPIRELIAWLIPGRGDLIQYKGDTITVRPNRQQFKNADVALFAAGTEVSQHSRQWNAIVQL